MKRFTIFAILLVANSSTIADAGRGQQLHQQHCTKCHDTSVYTRENRFVTSPGALRKQVKRCELNVGAQWLDKDINDVVQYLDQSFYKFKQ